MAYILWPKYELRQNVFDPILLYIYYKQGLTNVARFTNFNW